MYINVKTILSDCVPYKLLRISCSTPAPQYHILGYHYTQAVPIQMPTHALGTIGPNGNFFATLVCWNLKPRFLDKWRFNKVGNNHRLLEGVGGKECNAYKFIELFISSLETLGARHYCFLFFFLFLFWYFFFNQLKYLCEKKKKAIEEWLVRFMDSKYRLRTWNLYFVSSFRRH